MDEKQYENETTQTPSKPAGRKMDPARLEAYNKVKAVLAERPGEFSARELCIKHDVNYHAFMQWNAKFRMNKATKTPKFRAQYNPPVVGQSVLVTTMDDLMELLQPAMKEVIKGAVLEGIKRDRIKTMR